MKRIALTVVILAALVAGVLYWFTVERAARASRGDAVHTVLPESRQISANVLATGIVRLRVGAQIRVGAQVSGIVRKLNVSVGTHVAKGDVIAEIDTRQVDALIAQNRAQVAEDEVAVKKAERDVTRGNDMLSSGLLPRQQQEDLDFAANAARAKMEKSRTDLNAAEVSLSYCKIAAPISGTIASVATQEGETVASSFATPTFVTIIDNHAVELIAMVDEADIAAVKPGQTVAFTVESYPSRDLSGKVQRINPTATIVSGVVNYEVVIAIVGDSNLLKPDMTANVSIHTSQRNALLIPMDAVRGSGDARYVLVETPKGLERREVDIGNREGSAMEIRKGIALTDRVIVTELSESGRKREQP
jgi:RND family efflux transporter MFP subunit